MSLEKMLEEIVRRVVREELAAVRAPAATEQLLTIRDYAESRSVSQSTVRAALREGRLRSKVVGRGTKRITVRIPADADIVPASSPRAKKPPAPAANAERILNVMRGGRP